MHPAEIKAALELMGYSQSKIAEECGVTRSAVSMIVNGRGRSQQVEKHIAELLRRPRGDIWPLWYPEEVSYRGVREDGPLTDAELRLLSLYRALPEAQKRQALGMIEVLGGGISSAQSPSITVSGRGHRVAGRDYNVHPPKGKK